ncbi:MAG TPA: hypothetical protein VFY90_09165, partial [Tepidiformaceae bacterium]|nr:hypothetical protein [Tepidiformaceae bacterium]
VERGLPADILNYKNVTDPGFPYYPTSDLQYDQPQFESLRQLGYLAGEAMARVGTTPEDRKNKLLERETPAERFARVLAGYQALCAAPPPATPVDVTKMPPVTVSGPPAASMTGNGELPGPDAAPAKARRTGRTRTPP